ncbi:hypothetical protein P9112_006589 [Eukaryota sp. TZLM1-RC]
MRRIAVCSSPSYSSGFIHLSQKLEKQFYSFDANHCLLKDPFVFFSDGKTLLRRILNLIGYYQPHWFFNHNLMQFDLQVLKRRLNNFDLPFPTVRDDATVDVLSQLSLRWRVVVIRENGFFLLLILVFAKKFIKIPYGHGLGNLAYKTITEKKSKLHQEFSHILPIDCLATSPLRQNWIQYGLHDCILCLKLFVLFQKDKFILSSYKTIRATVYSMVKHSNVILKLRETALKFQQLRIHTTCCLKLYLQSRYERNFIPPRISAQLYESLMARIRYISAEYYGQEMVKPKSAFPGDFDNFVYGEVDYRLSTTIEQQKSNKTLSYVDHLRYRPEFVPQFPTDGFSRPPEYMAPVIYEKHINRFINIYFDKQDVENVLAEMHKLGGGSTPSSTIASLYRFRLRQHKNLFFVDDRDCLSSLLQYPQNISDLLNDEFFDLCEQHDIRIDELRDIFEGLIEPLTCQNENLVTDENLVDNIFPVDIHFLADAVEKDPQIFLKPAITIAQYISSREKKPDHISPVSTTVGPGYFPIDTRTIWRIIRQTLMDDLSSTQTMKMSNTLAQITKFKPPGQLEFCSNILDLNQTMFKQKSYKFNNIIHTDGFNIAVEFVHQNLQGQKCKPDNKASISDLYIDDVDTFQGRRIVVCDPGKRGLLYFGSKKTDQELVMVPKHKTEQQRNSRLMNQNKKYRLLRMTQMYCSLKSRMNEKQKRWATKYTEVDYDRNEMIESTEMTIEGKH